MSELLPCPFCGGEAESFNPFANTDGTWCVLCSECAAASGFEQTEAEAIAAWNSRAERTCRNLDKRYNIMFKCSECGHWECQDFDGEKILPQTWNYCPNCGARVLRNTLKYSETDVKVVGE